MHQLRYQWIVLVIAALAWATPSAAENTDDPRQLLDDIETSLFDDPVQALQELDYIEGIIKKDASSGDEKLFLAARINRLRGAAQLTNGEL
ncbi:MAG: hypothetical protein AAF205_08200, partial [Pseudomonadota bacterium]